MTIDIDQLRRLLNSTDMIDGIDLHANIKPIVRELLDRLEAAEKERDDLKAKIEAMEKQEPVAKVTRNAAGQIRLEDAQGNAFDLFENLGATLYAIPGAKGE